MAPSVAPNLPSEDSSRKAGIPDPSGESAPIPVKAADRFFAPLRLT